MIAAPTDARFELEQLTRERDLYRSLLDLGTREELEPFLEEALSLVVALSDARSGYIELAETADSEGEPIWLAQGLYDADVERIRELLSRGIIAEAIATGETIVTESALADPRFWSRGSVQRNRTEAVLCAPIGSPPRGVVYLQDRRVAGPFTEQDRGRVECFARHVAPFVERLLSRQSREQENDATAPMRKLLRADRLIGRSQALARVLNDVALVSPRDLTVLLTGPSGTGKTAIARVIHENSPRASGPFLELNCATFVEPLLESELFGALPGAHSTATRRVPGKIAAANGGTLFLDEVAELPLGSQAKLLQFLQDKTYFPLGSEKAEHADVRIIAATNADLRAAVAARRFREDLLYRLEVMPIRMPSLAERREDLTALADHFCAGASARHHLPKLRLSNGALRALEGAEWPGNVRELMNRVEAAAIRAAAEPGGQIEARHLFPNAQSDATGPESFQLATRRFQEQLLRRTLDECEWNVSEAAQRLELSRSHIYNLIAAFGLERAR